MRRLRAANTIALLCLLTALTPGIPRADAADLGREDLVSWPNSAPGRVMEAKVAILDSESTNFYASHFTMTSDPATVPGAGGYIGPQHDGIAGARSAVFAIWGATASTTGCASWDDTGDPTPGEGGFGFSCAKAVPWTDDGALITMRVERTGAGTGPATYGSTTMVDGSHWAGTVTTNGASVTLGTVFVPGTQHRIRPDYSFNEDWAGKLPDCNHLAYRTEILWHVPTTTSDAGTVSSASAPTSGNTVNTCAARAEYVDGPARVRLERGPSVLPPATGSGIRFVGDPATGYLYLDGSLNLDFPHAVGVTSTVNGAATPYNTVSAAGLGSRTYSVLAAKLPASRAGATFCALAENGARSSLGCLKVLAGSLGNPAYANNTLTIPGTVTRNGAGISTTVRARVGSTVGPAVQSNAAGAFNAQLKGVAPGSQVCVEGNESGVWVTIGCRAAPSNIAFTGKRIRTALSTTACVGPSGGSTANGTRIVVLASCTNAAAFSLTAGGELRTGGKCVEAGTGSTSTQVFITTCTGAAHQRWYHNPAAQTFTPTHSGLRLDLNNSYTAPGSILITFPATGGSNQRWVLL